jgi:hypothetical protein
VIATNQGGGANGGGSLAILLGNGDGTFQTFVDYDSGEATTLSVAVADVNGDRKLDLLAGNYGSALLTFMAPSECSWEMVMGLPPTAA